MLKLVGFAASNYYNVVKLALLEKGLAFEEQHTWAEEIDPVASPMGKVPYLLTEDGALSESAVILEYLEQRYPGVPLLPANPWAAAKVRELLRHSELHLELVARRLYPAAFFGGQVSGANSEQVRMLLERGAAAFAQLASFSPYVAGAEFTLADCAAICHLPLVSSASRIIYGQDLLSALPLAEYTKQLGSRPAVREVEAARRAGIQALSAHYASTR
ncbi:MAG: glutathione S-transferase [Candidatus Cloacimonetes bacterium]|nr:glutathione S-transferase [Candidatus Cloacimonadota bacterium]MCK9517091.1 glutathione S-transferase [Ottowia sp.]